MQALESLNPTLVLAMALTLVAVAMLVLGVSMVRRLRGQGRSRHVVDRALATRSGRSKAAEAEEPGRLAAAARAADSFGKRLTEGRLAEALLASEDRKLVDMAGYANPVAARSRFVAARFVLAILLPIAAVALDLEKNLIDSSVGVLIAAFLGFAVGYMLPKIFVRRRLARRRRQAADELPLLIDLLRLLQGVGLSIDQSLQVLVKEFAQVLPVLSYELRLATEQHVRGRTREQSLARLASGFDNDDISAICRLIAQVDQHGGAVQEPLQRFGERLRDKRRLDLKEKVGKTTVKMTGVMIVTLLPALLIVTGGAGFVAVLRGLSRMGGCDGGRYRKHDGQAAVGGAGGIDGGRGPVGVQDQQRRVGVATDSAAATGAGAGAAEGGRGREQAAARRARADAEHDRRSAATGALFRFAGLYRRLPAAVRQ